MSEEELDYVIYALEYLCLHAEKFLPGYNFDPTTGEWTHVKFHLKKPKFGLEFGIENERRYAKSEEKRVKLLARQKAKAEELVKTLPKSQSLDVMPELGNLAFFYGENGKIGEKQVLEKKMAFFRKTGMKN